MHTTVKHVAQKKTKADTDYCMGIWDAWQKERIEVDSEADNKMTPLIQINKEDEMSVDFVCT